MALVIIDSDIKAVITTNRDTSPFIETAALFVSEVLGSAGLTDQRIKLITIYIAAHFVWVTETFGLISKQSGDMHEEYHPRNQKPNTGLATSMYGKQALFLDTSGKLAAATTNNGLKATFKVYALRQRFSQQFPWWSL